MAMNVSTIRFVFGMSIGHLTVLLSSTPCTVTCMIDSCKLVCFQVAMKAHLRILIKGYRRNVSKWAGSHAVIGAAGRVVANECRSPFVLFHSGREAIIGRGTIVAKHGARPGGKSAETAESAPRVSECMLAPAGHAGDSDIDRQI